MESSWISLVILVCCLLRLIVRKKQIMTSSPMIIRKRKFEKVSKPSQLAKRAIGSGKIAMTIKTIGRSSQATELLIDIEFFLRKTAIRINKTMAAMVISIWRLVIFFPSET